MTTSFYRPLWRGLSFAGISVLAAVCCGCAQIGYSIVQPPELARPIGRRTVKITHGPIEYRLNDVSGHLVVRAYNRSRQAILLVNGMSEIVDPQGQPHPLAGGMMVPGSHIKLILLPLRPIYGPVGPDWGWGIAGDFPGRGWAFGWNVGDPVWYGPPYYPYYPADSALDEEDAANYWRWGLGGEVRLVLAFQYVTAAPAGLWPVPTTAPGPATEPTTEAVPASFKQEFVFRQTDQAAQ